MDSEEIKSIVLLAKNGDTTAFCKLYEQYYKDLYRFALYTLGNVHDAEDVISETVLDAFSEIKNLKKPESFKAWLFRILSIKCKRQLATNIDHKTNIVKDISEQKIISKEHPYEEYLDIQKAYQTLNQTEKLVISLIVFGGYNSRETAKILNRREGTIRSIKHRAFQKISDYLEEDLS